LFEVLTLPSASVIFVPFTAVTFPYTTVSL
jgi:hypothetical protein